MNLTEVLSRLKNVKESGKGYTALCPAHKDKQSSLSISEADDNKILLHCHAGCSIDSIVNALGLTITDLFPAKEQKTKKPKKPYDTPPEAEYLYYDLDGNVVHKTIRNGKQYDPAFLQARPDPNNPGKWIYNLKDTKTVIYKLPQVAAAIKENKPIFIVEGEKDADNLEKLGFTATTNPMGAEKWREHYSDQLLNAICYIIPDNDASGKKHANNISQSLIGKAALIKILDLTSVYPELKVKGDITDFFKELRESEGLKRLEQLIESSPEITADAVTIQNNNHDAELQELFKYTSYFINKGCLWRYGEDNDKFLANFVPIPTTTLRKDDGMSVDMFFKIKAITPTGKTLPEVTIPAEKFNSMLWIATAWGFEANYAPGSTIKDYIRHAIMSVGNTHAVNENIFTHTGWRKISDAWSYLYNGGAIGAENISVELDGNLANYAFPSHVDDYTEAVKADFKLLNVAPKRITLPLLAITYLSPLNEFLRQAKHEPAYITFLLGSSGVRKTTLAALFMCHYGRFSEKSLPGSFKDTANALEKKGFLLKDSLTVIDDYHPTMQRNQAARMETTAQEITRAYGDRTGRSRMNSDTSLKNAYVPRGNLIITGEDFPNIGQSGTSRNLVLEVKHGDVDMDLLTESQAQAGMLNHAMRGYIEWLIPQLDNLSERLQCMFLTYRDKAKRDKQHGRMAETVAWMQIGYVMFLDYAASLKLLPAAEAEAMSAEAFDIFLKLAEEQGNRIENDQPTAKFINAMREMLATSTCYVDDLKLVKNPDMVKGEGFIGYYDDDYYYLYCETVFKEVVKFYSQQGLNFPVSKETLLKQLDHEKLISVEIRDSRVNRVKVKSIGKEKKRLLWLRKVAVAEMEEVDLLKGAI